MRYVRPAPLFFALSLAGAACWLCPPRLGSLLAATGRISLGTCALAVPLGVFFALMFTKADLPGRRFAPAVLLTLLLTPLYVQTAGWETIVGKLGWWTFTHGGIQSALLAGEPAAIWIHAMAAWPWVALVTAVGLRSVDAACEDSARMLLPPSGVLGSVTLPSAAPFILLAAIWTAVTVAGEMTVTNIYFLRTYAEEIYSQFALDSSPTAVLVGVAPALLFLAAAVLVAAAFLPQITINRSPEREARFLLASNRARSIAAGVTWALLGLLVLVPASGLVHRAGIEVRQRDGVRERHWSATKAGRITAEATVKYAHEWRDTARIAGAAASLTVLLLLLPTWWAAGAGRIAWAAWLLALPALIPGPLVGMAVIGLMNRPELPWLANVYQRTSVPPILAVMTRTVPIAGWILLAAFASTPRDLHDTARLLGRSALERLWLIVRGCHLPALLAAWLAAAATAAGDLSCSVLVLPPGVDPIAFRLFGLLHAGADDQVAGMCLVLMTAILLTGTTISRLLPSRFTRC